MSIADRLRQVQARIGLACVTAGRLPQAVSLLAVSKTFDADAVRAAFAAGQAAFGENYADEALAKIAACGELPLQWHFIGPLQSNKTRAVAEHFSWVHSVDRLRIAQRLSQQRPAGLPPLQVLVQVNISGEASKSGCAPTDAAPLCAAIAHLPRLQLRGLMAIPAPAASGQAPREAFRQLRVLFEALRATLPEPAGFDTLSAGMSDDLEDAIAEGATLVRVGSAIFGARR